MGVEDPTLLWRQGNAFSRYYGANATSNEAGLVPYCGDDRRHLRNRRTESQAVGNGRLLDLRREADKLQADLVHLDAILRLYGLEPEDIPTKGRMPVRSAYFGRYEITRRCRDMIRERGVISAAEVSIQAMKDKGLDPNEKRVRADFTRRILISLHDLRKAGLVEKIGHGKGVKWQALDAAAPSLGGE